MSVDLLSQNTLHELLERSDWLRVAQSVYGFDRPTAERLVFVRWLRLTGRLSDDPCHRPGSVPYMG
jgi:hypothetical protein